MRTNVDEKTSLMPFCNLFILNFDVVTSFGKTGVQYPWFEVLYR